MVREGSYPLHVDSAGELVLPLAHKLSVYKFQQVCIGSVCIRVHVPFTVCVCIHVGVSDGQTLKVPYGHTETYVTVHVANSDVFHREGYDVHSDATVTFTQATLGGEVRVQGIDGPLDVKVMLTYIHVYAYKEYAYIYVCMYT